PDPAGEGGPHRPGQPDGRPHPVLNLLIKRPGRPARDAPTVLYIAMQWEETSYENPERRAGRPDRHRRPPERNRPGQAPHHGFEHHEGRTDRWARVGLPGGPDRVDPSFL